MCKTPNELKRLRAASALAEQALMAVLPGIQVGATEAQIARDFHLQAIRLGAQRLSFDTIVAGGMRAALRKLSVGLTRASIGPPIRTKLDGVAGSPSAASSAVAANTGTAGWHTAMVGVPGPR